MDKVVGVLKSFLPELVLALVVAVLLLLNVGSFEIDPYSEFFHIQSARESLAHGQWWQPVINGHAYLIRAPLWTWIVMAFFKVMGVSLVVARIPAVICSILALAFTYMLTTELTQSRFSALFAAAVLASGWGFFHGGSLSTADILATAIYTAFAWAFIQWHTFANRKNTIPLEMDVYSAGLGALLGLLILVKGTLAAALLVSIALLYLMLNRSGHVLQKLNSWLLLAPLTLIPAIWLIPATVQSGNSHFIWDYLLQQPIERLSGAGAWSGLQPDWLFFLKNMILDFMPYWLLLPAALLDSDLMHHSSNQKHGWTSWLLCWFALGLIVNSFSVFQEPTQMLMFMPPLAIMVGNYLGRAAEGKVSLPELDNTMVACIGLLMFCAVLSAVIIFQVVPSDYVRGFWHFPGQAIIETLQLGKHQIDLPEAFPLWKFWLVPGPFILLAGGFFLYLFQSERRLFMTPAALLGSVFGFLLFVKLLYLPIMARPVSETFARQLNHQVKSGDRIVLASLQANIKRVLFYLDTKKLARVRVVSESDFIKQNLEPTEGVMYGIMPEQSYFEGLSGADRNRLQVMHADWNWDTANLSELKKFLAVRQPQFDLMKARLVSFQSLPPASLQALRESIQAEALLAGEQQETPRRKKRRR